LPAQLAELDRRLDELPAGIDVIAVSAETRDASEQLQVDWKLERLPTASGLADRLRYASEIDSEGPRVAPRGQCDSLER
jgi:hypothetical protein